MHFIILSVIDTIKILTIYSWLLNISEMCALTQLTPKFLQPF